MKVLIVKGERIESNQFYNLFLRRGCNVSCCHVHDLSFDINYANYDLIVFNFFHDAEFNRRFAKRIVYGIDQLNSSAKVWPDLRSCTYYDDKLSQAYQFLALQPYCDGVRFAETKVFYSYREFIKWVDHHTFPFVVKLSTGAGSHNVKLIKSRLQALLYASISFTIGRSRKGSYSIFMDRYKSRDILGILRSLGRVIVPSAKGIRGREAGYIIAQEYFSGNDGDIRIVVIRNKAIGIRRGNRPDDFRASGSGVITYEVSDLPRELILTAFDLSKLFSMEIVAFDFLKDKSEFILIESSYTVSYDSYNKCKGYWDTKGVWIDANIDLRELIVDALSFT